MNKFIALMGVSTILLSACATGPKAKPTTETDIRIVAEVTKKPKYKPLVYGEEKPLICTDLVLARGKLTGRPNLQVMWENYLYDRPAGIWGEIGGLVEVNGNLPFDQGQWTNACTVRLSHMLNKAGHKIPRVPQQTVSGGNKDQYYYRVADLEAYLIKTYGKPDVEIVDGTGNQFDLPITPGIVLMDFPNSSYTGHVTIWNGAGTVDGANIGGYRVLFWHLPCFIPAGRKVLVNANDGSVSVTP